MAEPHWLGTAANIKQVETFTVTGSWATGDTGTVTINGNDVTITVGATDTATTDVATALKEAINQTTALDGTIATGTTDATSNIGGQTIPEFKEVTATVSASTVTLTGNTAGKPFTISLSETTATTGSLGSPTTSTAATGQHHWDNADNWSTGAVPVNSDDVVIDGRAVASIKYGLNQSAVTLTSLTIKSTFQSPLYIGLPEVNSDSSSTYSEYRETYLRISATNVYIGEGSGTMSGRVKLDLGTAASTVLVYRTGTTAETGVPALLIKGSNASNNLYISSGNSNVGLCFFDGETAQFPTVESNGVCVIGDSATLTNVDVNGGVTTLYSATTTLDVIEGRAVIHEGAHGTLNVYGNAEADYRSTGTVTTCEVSGHLNCANDPRGRTITNVLTLKKGSKVSDPHKTLTLSAGFQTDHCRLKDVDIDFGIDATYTIS